MSHLSKLHPNLGNWRLKLFGHVHSNVNKLLPEGGVNMANISWTLPLCKLKILLAFIGNLPKINFDAIFTMNLVLVKLKQSQKKRTSRQSLIDALRCTQVYSGVLRCTQQAREWIWWSASQIRNVAKHIFQKSKHHMSPHVTMQHNTTTRNMFYRKFGHFKLLWIK